MIDNKTSYISTPEAIALHVVLMRLWREVRFGVDRKDLLDSALNRPKQAANFENADIIQQAATLCFGLVKNHPWFGGNKRTATFLMDFFLETNGLAVKTTDEEMAKLAIDVDLGVLNVDDISDWLSKRITKSE